MVVCDSAQVRWMERPRSLIVTKLTLALSIQSRRRWNPRMIAVLCLLVEFHCSPHRREYRYLDDHNILQCVLASESRNNWCDHSQWNRSMDQNTSVSGALGSL